VGIEKRCITNLPTTCDMAPIVTSWSTIRIDPTSYTNPEDPIGTQTHYVDAKRRRHALATASQTPTLGPIEPTRCKAAAGQSGTNRIADQRSKIHQVGYRCAWTSPVTFFDVV
jgi:hypothetical protein